jgi:hypothetical protein
LIKLLLRKLPALKHVRGIHLKIDNLSEKEALHIWVLIQRNPNIAYQFTQFDIKNSEGQSALENAKRKHHLAQLSHQSNVLQHKHASSDDSSESESPTKKNKIVRFADDDEEQPPVHTVLGFHAHCGLAQNLHTAIEKKELGSVVIIKSKVSKEDFRNICMQPCSSPEFLGMPALFLAAQIFNRFELISQLLSCGASADSLISVNATEEIAHLNIIHFCCLRGNVRAFDELEKNLDIDDMAMLANERVFTGIYQGLTALDILCLQVQKHSENFELDDATKMLLTKLISFGAKSSTTVIDTFTNAVEISEIVDYALFVSDICNRLLAHKSTAPTALVPPIVTQLEVPEPEVIATSTTVGTALAIPVTGLTEEVEPAAITTDIESQPNATVTAVRNHCLQKQLLMHPQKVCNRIAILH